MCTEQEWDQMHFQMNDEMRWDFFKFHTFHRLLYLIRAMGIKKEQEQTVVEAILILMEEVPGIADIRNIIWAKKDYLRRSIAKNWKEEFQKEKMYELVPNYLNSIREDETKRTEYFRIKAMNYLENYSFVAKLVETYKKSMPNKKEKADDDSEQNLCEDEEDETLAYYSELMMHMEKYLETMMEIECVPGFLKNVKTVGITDAISRLPKVESMIQKAAATTEESQELAFDASSEHVLFEKKTELWIRTLFPKPCEEGNLKSSITRMERRLEFVEKKLIKAKEELLKITEETPTKTRLLMYLQAYLSMEYLHVTGSFTELSKNNSAAEREMQLLCTQILKSGWYIFMKQGLTKFDISAEYNWLQEFRAKKKVSSVFNFSPLDMFYDQRGTPKQPLPEMTEIAINVIVTAVEHLNKTQPDCQIPLISDEFQQLAKSQGIWDGWHRIHSVQIGYLKHVEQQAQKIQQGFEKIKAIINSESPLPTSQEQVEHGQAVSSVKTVFENLLKDIRSLKYEPAPDPRQSTHKALQKPNPLSGPVSATSNLNPPQKVQTTPLCPEPSNSTLAKSIGKPNKLVTADLKPSAEPIETTMHSDPNCTIRLQDSISPHQSVSHRSSPNLLSKLPSCLDSSKSDLAHPVDSANPQSKVKQPEQTVVVQDVKVGESQGVVRKFKKKKSRLFAVFVDPVQTQLQVEQPIQTVASQPTKVDGTSKAEQIVQPQLEMPTHNNRAEPPTQIVVQNVEVYKIQRFAPEPHIIKHLLKRNGQKSNRNGQTLKRTDKNDVEKTIKKKRKTRRSLPIRILRSVPKMRIASKKVPKTAEKTAKQKHIFQQFLLATEQTEEDEQPRRLPVPREPFIRRERISTNRPTVHKMPRVPIPAQSTLFSK